MIIEIALGIVLAVFILIFIREILSCALVLFGIAVALVVIGFVGYFVVMAIGVEAASFLLALAIVGWGIWYGLRQEKEAEREANKRAKDELKDRTNDDPQS